MFSCSDIYHKPLLQLFYSILFLFQCSSPVSVDLSSPLVRVVKYRPILSLSWEQKVRWRKKKRGREWAEGN